MNLKKNITLAEQERCNGDMMSTSVLKNSRVSNPAIFSKNFTSGSILSISKNYLTQFNLHSQILFSKTIGTILFMLTLYITLLLYALYKLSFWDFSLLKDTIFWFSTTALVCFFTINKAKNNNYFKGIIKENLKWAIAMEFLVNFYTFSLTTELILVPILIFLGLLQAISDTDKKYTQVSKLFKNVFGVFGLALLVFTTYKTFKNYQELFTVHNLFSFLLPPILTVLVIPFLYVLAIYMNYEELFVRVNIISNDKEKNKLLKRKIILIAKLNLNRLTVISKKLNKSDWYQSDDELSYLPILIDDQPLNRRKN
jgi:hypothetical protein